MLSNCKMLGPVVEFPSYTTQFQPGNIFCGTSSELLFSKRSIQIHARFQQFTRSSVWMNAIGTQLIRLALGNYWSSFSRKEVTSVTRPSPQQTEIPMCNYCG